MKQLYARVLCPFSSALRVYMQEKQIEHQLVLKNLLDKKFDGADCYLEYPILLEEERKRMVISGFASIVEYINDENSQGHLSGRKTQEKYEIIRLVEVVNSRFYAEVSCGLIYEKVLKRYEEKKSPDSSIIRKSISAIKLYDKYIGWLMDRRNWLAGEDFSLADAAAAAHVACVDYLGVIDWDQYPSMREWYMRVKSRPSFRDILLDKVPGIPPSECYSKLDF